MFFRIGLPYPVEYGWPSRPRPSQRLISFFCFTHYGGFMAKAIALHSLYLVGCNSSTSLNMTGCIPSIYMAVCMAIAPLFTLYGMMNFNNSPPHYIWNEVAISLYQTLFCMLHCHFFSTHSICHSFPPHSIWQYL